MASRLGLGGIFGDGIRAVSGSSVLAKESIRRKTSNENVRMSTEKPISRLKVGLVRIT